MLNKKGLTLVELLAAVAILGILSGVAIMAVSKYQKKTRDEVYKNFENQLKNGTINYLTSNISEIPQDDRIFSSNELQEKNYLGDLVDPVTKTKQCSGSVKVHNNGNITNPREVESITYDENGNMIINSSNTKNLDLTYTVCLKCDQYTSKTCWDY